MLHAAYPHIFEPFKIRNMVVKNRIVMPPMGGNFAGEFGQITESHIKYYEQRAKGGTGLIIVENCNVDYPMGANGATQLRIDHERYIPGLNRLAETVKKHGAKACVQINHAGASSSSERTEGHGTVGPSNIATRENGEEPRPLTQEEIAAIAVKFGKAAGRAQTAGFDAVEVQAGHAYLLAQFLSRATNKRCDQYGGCVENRARFTLMVLQEVRKNVGPDFPVLIRIGADEFTEEGVTLEETLSFLEIFKPYVDLVDVSAGVHATLERQIETMNFPEGAKVYLSEAVRKGSGLPTITSGNIRHPAFAERVLSEEKADFIAIGRGLICDPNWVKKTMAGEPQKIRRCISCNIGCVGNRVFGSRPISCTLNPDLVGEDEYQRHKVSVPTNVVIIGGGPAGLEAACTAAEVGCNAYLFEKEQEVGGLLRLIRNFPAKNKINYLVEYLDQRMAVLKNLVIFHGRTPTIREIDELKPDLVVNATGSRPALPPVKGLQENVNREGSPVYTVTELLNNIDAFTDLKGKRVVVAGGGAVGLDCMEFFAEQGAEVTIVDRNSRLGADLDPLTRKYLVGVIKEHGIGVHFDTQIEEFTRSEIVCSRKNETFRIGFDLAMVCLGFRSENQQVEALQEYYYEKGVEFINIGDSSRPRKIGYGIVEGRSIRYTTTLLGRLG